MGPDEGFIVDAEGCNGVFGVFEDDGATGYLYLYAPDGEGISRHVHIYDRSPSVAPQEADVQVMWSNDQDKCGVLIWGQMRGIIDLKLNREARAWIEGRSTPGIVDPDWMNGF